MIFREFSEYDEEDEEKIKENEKKREKRFENKELKIEGIIDHSKRDASEQRVIKEYQQVDESDQDEDKIYNPKEKINELLILLEWEFNKGNDRESLYYLSKLLTKEMKILRKYMKNNYEIFIDDEEDVVSWSSIFALGVVEDSEKIVTVAKELEAKLYQFESISKSYEIFCKIIELYNSIRSSEDEIRNCLKEK